MASIKTNILMGYLWKTTH